MSCSVKPMKRLLFCCDLDSETILLLVSLLVLYIGLIHFFNWIVYFCLFIVVPYLVLIAAYFIGGISLFVGVLYSRKLIYLFPFMMAVALIADLIYMIMLYYKQDCIGDNLDFALTDHYTAYQIVVPPWYYYMGVIAGINFVITFYIMLLVIDYLSSVADCC